jgi:hypothetical protein
MDWILNGSGRFALESIQEQAFGVRGTKAYSDDPRHNSVRGERGRFVEKEVRASQCFDMPMHEDDYRGVITELGGGL